MTKENQDIITGIMGVEPIYINFQPINGTGKEKDCTDKHTGH